MAVPFARRTSRQSERSVDACDTFGSIGAIKFRGRRGGTYFDSGRHRTPAGAVVLIVGVTIYGLGVVVLALFI
jgi:hypothetical protein